MKPKEILKIISEKKTITREMLRKQVTPFYPDEPRWKLSYAITSLEEKGYIAIKKSSARKWNDHDTISITKLGKAQIKLLELKSA